MAELNREGCFSPLVETLPGGCFLVTGKEEPNVMTVGWATTGIMWGKQVMMIPVRLSRYSHEKLEEYPEFTVCIPPTGEKKKELGVCGSKSGRDMDKAKELGLSLVPAREVSVPVIEGSQAVYECRIMYKLEMCEAHMQRDVIERFYPQGDLHTLYFAEILACYTL